MYLLRHSFGKGVGAAAGPVAFTHLTARPGRPFENITRPTTIASNTPVHAQSLAPFCRRRNCFCPQRKGQEQQNKQTNCTETKGNTKYAVFPQHGGHQPGIQTHSRSTPGIKHQQPDQNDSHVQQQLCRASAGAFVDCFCAGTIWRRESAAGEIAGEEGRERASESEEERRSGWERARGAELAGTGRQRGTQT